MSNVKYHLLPRLDKSMHILKAKKIAWQETSTCHQPDNVSFQNVYIMHIDDSHPILTSKWQTRRDKNKDIPAINSRSVSILRDDLPYDSNVQLHLCDVRNRKKLCLVQMPAARSPENWIFGHWILLCVNYSSLPGQSHHNAHSAAWPSPRINEEIWIRKAEICRHDVDVE